MSHNIGRYAGSFLDPFFDNLFEDVNSENFGALSMKTDIKENQDKYTLEVELPGFDKNNISLNLKDGYLTVTAKVNRSIKHEEGKKDEIVAGPLRCQQEIFNGCKEIPTIEVKPERSNHEIGQNLRYGIKDDEYEYRYFIIDEGFEWNCRTTRAVYDWKTIEKEKVFNGVKEKNVNVTYTAIPYTGKLE